MSQVGRGHLTDTSNYWAPQHLPHIGGVHELNPRSTFELVYGERAG